MPIIALFLLFALLYWLWPYILAISIAASIFFIYKVVRKRQKDVIVRNQIERNFAKAVENIADLRSRYLGLYGVQKVDHLIFIKIKDIKIDQGIHKKRLLVEIGRIKPDVQIQDAPYRLGSDIRLKLELQTLAILDIEGGDDLEAYSLHMLTKTVSFFLSNNLSIDLFAEVSVESRLVELLFLNNPELQWATAAITKIENALAPVAAAYSISLTNELLQGNQEFLFRAMEVLENEKIELQSYAQESSNAMRKAYEFLNIPLALRNFENLDTKLLEIYSRKKDMRESFQAAIDIKREYDNLRNT